MSKKEDHKNTVALYWRLMQYVRKYWIAFIIAVVANASYSGVDAGMTYLLKPILNKGFIHRDIHFVSFLPFMLFGLFIVRGISSLCANYFMARVSRGVVKDFRQKIFHHLLKLPAEYFDRMSSGRILSVLLYNVEQVSSAGSDTLTTLIQSFCLIVGLFVVMFSISWRLTILYVFVTPLIAIVVKLSSKRMRRISLSIQSKMGEITTVAEEAIEGYKVIRAFGGGEYERKKFDKVTLQNFYRQLKIIVTKSFTSIGVQLLAAVVLISIIYLSTLHQSSTMLSAGAFVSLISAMLMILKPLKNFTDVNNKIQQGLAAADSVFELLDEPVEKDTGTVVMKRAKGKVDYKDVNFSYPQTKKRVLENVNFSVQPGQMMALVGHSGGGKTTIVNLLQRYYECKQGEILIDGVNIKDITLDSLRKQIAVVSQGVTLFNDTIEKNIAYGCFANVSRKRIIEAAKAAYAWEFIEQMPKKLKTLIGENGVLLSGGQRQRIAIARAILKNAPILILDEATSALDTKSERKIQKAMDGLMENRTSIVIAHRLSTIEKANEILLISEGQIVESGTHDTLLAESGYYAKLYNMQFSQE